MCEVCVAVARLNLLDKATLREVVLLEVVDVDINGLLESVDVEVDERCCCKLSCTIGSKAQDVEIAKRVIDIKAEIEKIREQVQNIE